MISEENVRQMALEDSDAQYSAPEFQLPGTDGSEWAVHSLTDYTSRGVSVLGFYPLESLDEVEPLTWLQFTDGVDVMIVTDVRGGSFEDDSPLPGQSLVLLLDPDTEVGESYGVDYRDPAIFLIDSSNEILETWSGRPDLERLHSVAVQHVGSPGSSEQRGGD